MHVMNVNVVRYSLLYSLYSWPNIVLPLFGGFLVTLTECLHVVRLGAIVFSFLVCTCAGQVRHRYNTDMDIHAVVLNALPFLQLIVAVGAFADHYWLMLFGRLVFG